MDSEHDYYSILDVPRDASDADIRRAFRTCRQDYSAIWLLREGRDGPFDLSRLAQVDWAYVDTDRWRHRLDDSKLADSLSSASLSENSRVRHAWRNLLE